MPWSPDNFGHVSRLHRQMTTVLVVELYIRKSNAVPDLVGRKGATALGIHIERGLIKILYY